MKLQTALALGRVSNLPTVWSNVLCGVVLAEAVTEHSSVPLFLAFFDEYWFALVLLTLCGTALYTGGMFLNDAFDAALDAEERPERPIPSGLVTRRQVFGYGYALLGLGLLLAAALPLLEPSRGPLGVIAAGFTCLSILVYNRWHKGFGWAPLVMGLCRIGLYLTAAFSVGATLSFELAAACLALWFYVVGLTHVARFETGSVVRRAWILGALGAPAVFALANVTRSPATLLILALFAVWVVYAVRVLRSRRPGSIGRTVVSLIAGISLVDALFIVSLGGTVLSLLPLLLFRVTLAGQRRIAAT